MAIVEVSPVKRMSKGKGGKKPVPSVIMTNGRRFVFNKAGMTAIGATAFPENITAKLLVDSENGDVYFRFVLEGPAKVEKTERCLAVVGNIAGSLPEDLRKNKWIGELSWSKDNQAWKAELSTRTAKPKKAIGGNAEEVSA